MSGWMFDVSESLRCLSIKRAVIDIGCAAKCQGGSSIRCCYCRCCLGRGLDEFARRGLVARKMDK